MAGSSAVRSAPTTLATRRCARSSAPGAARRSATSRCLPPRQPSLATKRIRLTCPPPNDGSCSPPLPIRLLVQPPLLTPRDHAAFAEFAHAAPPHAAYGLILCPPYN